MTGTTNDKCRVVLAVITLIVVTVCLRTTNIVGSSMLSVTTTFYVSFNRSSLSTLGPNKNYANKKVIGQLVMTAR